MMGATCGFYKTAPYKNTQNIYYDLYRNGDNPLRLWEGPKFTSADIHIWRIIWTDIHNTVDVHPRHQRGWLTRTGHVGIIKLDKKWQQWKIIKEEFRNRFRNEYLGLLQQRAKLTRQKKIKVRDIILIGSDKSRRINWPVWQALLRQS